MTTIGAFGRLFPPSLFLFIGILILRDWRSEPVLIGIALCAASLAWLIVATVRVAKVHEVAPVAARGRGFPVLPAQPDNARPVE
jgi:hypothetical protein